MENNKEGVINRLLKNFNERMKIKGQKEAEEAEIEAEKLRQAYLKRTGREKMKP